MTGPWIAAQGLDAQAELVWERLRAEFGLQSGFWLAFLFGAQSMEVAELTERTRGLALAGVQHVEELRLTEPADVARIMARLVSRSDENVAATWVTDDPLLPQNQRLDLWVRLLHRLNERRDVVRVAHRAALLLACPADFLVRAREEAPDLWSFRSLTATLTETRFRDLEAADRPAVPASLSARLLARAAGPLITPGPRVGDLVRQSAAALRRGDVDKALTLVHEARALSTTTDDLVLVDAWLAQARQQQGDVPSAARLAVAALAAGRPLELDTTVELLEIVVQDADPTKGEEAAQELLQLRRVQAQRFSDNPEHQRALLPALDVLARLMLSRGALDEALSGYQESLDLARRLLAEYGPGPGSLRDLSVSLDKTAGVRERQGALDEALSGYQEAMRCLDSVATGGGLLADDVQRLSMLSKAIERTQAVRLHGLDQHGTSDLEDS